MSRPSCKSISGVIAAASPLSQEGDRPICSGSRGAREGATASERAFKKVPPTKGHRSPDDA